METMEEEEEEETSLLLTKLQCSYRTVGFIGRTVGTFVVI